MAAASPISINDATPTSHTFNPVSVSSNLSLFRNTSGASTSATEEQIGLSLSRASAGRSTNKVKITFAMPFEQTIDGAVVARSVARMNCELILPDDMSSSERDDFAALVSNLLDATAVQAYIADLEPVW